MMKFPAKKAKSTQYVIGGTVGVLILALWVSLPLMSGSSMDGGVAAGNPFKSKVADLSALSDIPSEGGAPGSPLSGEMINNPATSGEDIASSLFQSGPDSEVTAEAEASADTASGAVPAPSSTSGGVPSAGGPRGKLSAAPSITGGNSNSMTAGGLHNKFFGSGSNKAEVAPALPGADLKKMGAKDNKGALVAMLSNSADKSALAAKSGKMDAAQNGAASAFGASAKAAGSDLDNDFEGQAMDSGLQLGQTAQDLKKSDPSLSKTKVTPPSKPKDATDESEEMKQQIKMMIIQMVLKAMFAGMGAAV
ncbi:MAG: hypothetical protein A2X31_03365 [Elusimicrobia bacterium GWB2_63_22]|nr:MAG: hypothetical protein A2X31_03365 [Elusimicrobia bacterium GWB2_63_22]